MLHLIGLKKSQAPVFAYHTSEGSFILDTDATYTGIGAVLSQKQDQGHVFAATDGMVEHFNRTLEAMLLKFVDENQKDWYLYLPFLMMAYWSSVH